MIQIANVPIEPKIAGSGNLGAPDPDVERRPVRTRQVGLGDAQLDHRELCRREREQDAEGEEAREERRRRAR